MNREIKFRAWDEENKSFVYQGSSRNVDAHSFWKWVAYDSTQEVQQFTGLLDKNGKEIYEGDVVAGYKCRYEVVYGSGAFMWGEDFLGYNVEGDYDCHVEILPIGCETLEIIGNIYENPELTNNI